MPTTTRGREYDPEAERYLCCGSRSCWWCERGTVRVPPNDGNYVSVTALREKMINPSWWMPSISWVYLKYLIDGSLRALVVLEAQGKKRVPLRLTGERFDSTDANRVRTLAELPFTKEDETALLRCAFLEMEGRGSEP